MLLTILVVKMKIIILIVGHVIDLNCQVTSHLFWQTTDIFFLNSCKLFGALKISVNTLY